MRRFWCTIVTAIIVASCSTTPMPSVYHVNVSSLAGSVNTSFGRYTIVPIDESTSPSDLQFQEYSRYIIRSLPSSSGVYVKPDAEPDIVILLGYGIGDPSEEISSFAMPQFGQTGVSSAQTYGTMSSYGNYGTYSGTTTYTPSFGITGYTTHVQSSRTHQRNIELYAYDIRSDVAKPKQIWRTAISSRGTNSDLRSVFPVMIVSAHPFIASNTGETVTIEIAEDDERISTLKREASP